ncbi:hypothetical protein E0I61_10115 [Flavobacterium ranwuense]|uniref:Uncharacterized protein n=1 Tax=Flavobacterium ranwuense TaxID=2541725 RepID=A0ABY2DQC7_9FLAO|nr:hypothetical protein [Flavobacterium ranwuense]TDE28741.1 hypothetical protein E0I61_10115 [Flavobacterium ranwuense]
MKTENLMIIVLSLFITSTQAQKKTNLNSPKKTTTVAAKPAAPKLGKNVQEIKIKNEAYFLTKEIGYPITGDYLFESKKDPIVQLNSDGTGLFQNHQMSRTPMVWGIECDMDGTPKKIKADWGFMYNLWYQIKAKHKGASWESGEIDAWDVVSFSVHTDENKIYILGERIKTY